MTNQTSLTALMIITTHTLTNNSMTYQITWREVNLGHMIVETEEEAQEFIQQPDMDDPRFTWKKKVYDIDYVEMITREEP